MCWCCGVTDEQARFSYQELLNEEAVSVPEPLCVSIRSPTCPTTSLPRAVWTNRLEVFEKEVEHLWPKVWQMVCRETAFQKAGDYYVYDIARYSILLVRTSQELKGFHNSCLHRGRALKSGRGTSRRVAVPLRFLLAFGWPLQSLLRLGV